MPRKLQRPTVTPINRAAGRVVVRVLGTVAGNAFLRDDTNVLATFVMVCVAPENLPRHGLMHAFASKKHPKGHLPTLRVREESFELVLPNEVSPHPIVGVRHSGPFGRR